MPLLRHDEFPQKEKAADDLPQNKCSQYYPIRILA